MQVGQHTGDQRLNTSVNRKEQQPPAGLHVCVRVHACARAFDQFRGNNIHSLLPSLRTQMHNLTMTEEKQNIESFFSWRLELQFISPEQRVQEKHNEARGRKRVPDIDA